MTARAFWTTSFPVSLTVRGESILLTRGKSPAVHGRMVSRLAPVDAEELCKLETLDPLELLPATTIHAVLKHAAATWPKRDAIIQLMTADDPAPERIAYAEYLARAERAANLFHHESAGEPAVVGVIAPYLSEALVAMWGGAIAGRYVPINPYLEPAHVAAILVAAKATVLVIATDQHGPGVWSGLGDLVDAVPTLKRVFRIQSGDQGDDFALCCAAHVSGELAFTPATNPRDDCAFMHTGGTTAAPKLVRHSHGGQLVQAWLCGMAMGNAEHEVIGHAMPNFHLGGAIAVGLRAIVYGQTVVTLTPSGFRNPAIVSNFWPIVAQFGITSITTAPTTAAAILAAGGAAVPCLTSFTTGGSALPVSLAQAFEDHFGITLKEVWGGTEFQGILSFHYAAPTRPRWGSCGRVVPFCDVRSAILDGQAFVREARPDERGTLIAAAPTLVEGFANPEADAGFFLSSGPDQRRWATTGDIGRVDDDRFIWIGGRAKDVIIRGGHNIDSAMIDDALAGHPEVVHVAAVGKPCPRAGELPMVFVERKAGSQLSSDDLEAFAREVIPERAAVPVDIRWIDAMPLTAVGKVFKPPLKDRAVVLVIEEQCAIAGVEACAIRIEEGTAVVSLPASDGEAAKDLAASLARFAFHCRIDLQPVMSSTE